MCGAQLLCAGSSGAQERRTALVIGNSAYRKSPLVNPVNDAQAMAAALKSVGFTVAQIENASKNQMAEAIRKFGETIKLGGVGLFYFAGHGLQVDGENFLIPVDDDIQDKSQVVGKGLEAKLVLREMGNAKNRLNIVILDACRDNPFKQSASRGLVQADTTSGLARSDGSGGLAAMEALVGTFIAFATAPESVAADGSGRNGVYTENLLRNLTEPGLKIEDVFKRTRFGVRQETGGRQVPWENTSLEGDFYFVAPPTGGAVASGSAGLSASLPADRQTVGTPSRSETATPKPTRSPSGFSFSREEEKDRAASFGKDDEIRARLQAPCPEVVRQRPIVIDITEESRAEGLMTTEKSSRFGQLVSQNLQQAGLTTSLGRLQGQPAKGSPGRTTRPQDSYSIQGVVLSQQGSNRVARLNEASVSAELALRDPAGRIMTIVEVSGDRFAGQDTNAATRALTKEQANDASSQLYAAFCGARVDVGRPGR
jgi:uncharacterized caspase-like protein